MISRWAVGVVTAQFAFSAWCASSVEPTLRFCSYSVRDGVVTAEVTSSVDSKIALVSGASDKGADWSAWDHCTEAGFVLAGRRTSVTVTIPAGDVCARLFVAKSEYDTFEYLEGDGETYLELDYTLSSADKVEIVAMPTCTDKTASGQSGVFGSRNGHSEKNFTLARTVNLSVTMDFNNSGYEQYRCETAWAVSNKASFVVSADERTENGVGNTVPCGDVFVTDYPCRLFSYAGEMPTSYRPAFMGRIYSFAITTLATGAAQRYLVAVNLGTVDEPRPAMYDLNTGATYENVSTVSGAKFTLGPNNGGSCGRIAGIAALGPLMTRSEFIEEPSIEDGLMAIRCLQTDANGSTVDTEVEIHSSDKVAMKFALNSAPVGGGMGLFGARTPGAGALERCFAFLDFGEQLRFDYLTQGEFVDAETTPGVVYSVSCSAKDGIVLNGKSYGGKPEYSDFTAGSSLHLFGLPDVSNPGYVNFADVTFYEADVFWTNGMRKAEIRPFFDGKDNSVRLRIMNYDEKGLLWKCRFADVIAGQNKLQLTTQVLSTERRSKTEVAVEFILRSAADLCLASGRKNRMDDLLRWDRVEKIESFNSSDCAKIIRRTVAIPDNATYVRFFIGNECRECASLKGDGEAYLELDYTLTGADAVDAEIIMGDSVTGQSIFGARTDANTGNIAAICGNVADETMIVDFANSSNQGGCRANGKAVAKAQYSVHVDSKLRCVTDTAGKVVCKNDKASTDGDFSTPRKCCVFLARGCSDQWTSFKGSVLSLVISRGGSEKVHLVPYGDRFGGNGCMYDTVNGRYYMNVGNGSFDAGAVVENSALPKFLVVNCWSEPLMVASPGLIFFIK